MKIKLLSNKTVMVVSSLKKDDIEMIKNLAPDFLELKNENGNTYFKINVSERAYFGENGIVFNEETTTGQVMVTLEISDLTAEQFVYKYAFQIRNLRKIEEKIRNILPDLMDEMEELSALVETVL